MGLPTIYSQLTGSNSWGKAINPTCDNDPLCSNEDNSTIVGAIVGLIGLAGAVLVGLLSGFSAIYILALVIVVAILNFFVFPIGIFITPEVIAPEIGYPILFVFNIIEVLAITDFVRGGA
jgi:hypothetical protein